MCPKPASENMCAHVIVLVQEYQGLGGRSLGVWSDPATTHSVATTSMHASLGLSFLVTKTENLGTNSSPRYFQNLSLSKLDHLLCPQNPWSPFWLGP